MNGNEKDKEVVKLEFIDFEKWTVHITTSGVGSDFVLHQQVRDILRR